MDSRMASFESVLHKTASQVKTARARLAEGSNMDPAGRAAAGSRNVCLAGAPVLAVADRTA